MFEALQTISDDKKLTEDQLFDFVLENLQYQSDALQKAVDLEETLSNLELLKSSIEMYGLSSSLLAFADHNQILSRHIPEMPSLESYLADSNIDKAIAVEGLDDTIKKIAQRWFSAFMEHIVKYKKWYTAAGLILLGLWGIGTYSVMSLFVWAGAPTSLLISAFSIQLISAALFTGITTAVLCSGSTPLAIREALSLRLPDTEEKYTSYENKVKEIFKTKAHVNIDNFDEPSELLKPEHKTLEELGYTPENLKELAEKTKAAVDELGRCDFIATDLEKLAKTPEAETQIGRSALMFLSNIIKKSMNLAMKHAGEATKELKTIGSHIEEKIKEHKEKEHKEKED